MSDIVYALGVVSATSTEAATAPPQSPLAGFLPIILVFVIFYFLLIRPQQKKQKEHQIMLSKLKKGDKVITSGGIHGEVIGIKDKEDIVVLKIAENVKVEFQRNSISHVKTS